MESRQAGRCGSAESRLWAFQALLLFQTGSSSQIPWGLLKPPSLLRTTHSKFPWCGGCVLQHFAYCFHSLEDSSNALQFSLMRLLYSFLLVFIEYNVCISGPCEMSLGEQMCVTITWIDSLHFSNGSCRQGQPFLWCGWIRSWGCSCTLCLHKFREDVPTAIAAPPSLPPPDQKASFMFLQVWIIPLSTQLLGLTSSSLSGFKGPPLALGWRRAIFTPCLGWGWD